MPSPKSSSGSPAPARETQPGDARLTYTEALELTTGAPGRDVEALAEQVRRAARAVLALPPGDARLTYTEAFVLRGAIESAEESLRKLRTLHELLTFRRTVTHSDEETRREALVEAMLTFRRLTLHGPGREKDDWGPDARRHAEILVDTALAASGGVRQTLREWCDTHQKFYSVNDCPECVGAASGGSRGVAT